MPSNGERREVAARLREKHYERQGMFEPQCIEIQASNRLYALLDCLPERRDMFLVLADLIEPEERTCRVERRHVGPLYIVYKFSCCEEEWAESNTDQHASAIDETVCPRCGAKVIE